MNKENDDDLGLIKDPDFRLKNLEKLYEEYSITCSKCHHCRR